MTQVIPKGATHRYPKYSWIQWYKQVNGVWHYFADNIWQETYANAEWIANELVEIKP